MSKKKKDVNIIPSLPPGFRREELNSSNTTANIANFSSMLSTSSALASAKNNSSSSTSASPASPAIVTAKAFIHSPVPANKDKSNFPSRVLQQTLVLERNLTNFERASLSKLSVVALNPAQMNRMGLSTSELVLVSYAHSIPRENNESTTLHDAAVSSPQKTQYWLCEAWPLQTIALNSVRMMLHPLSGFDMPSSTSDNLPHKAQSFSRNHWVTSEDLTLTRTTTSLPFSSLLPSPQLSLHTPPPGSSIVISVLPRLPISVNSIVFMRIPNPVLSPIDSSDSFEISESFESSSLPEHSISNALNCSLQQTLITHLTSMPFLLGSAIRINVTNSLVATSGLAGSVSGKIVTFVPLAVRPSFIPYSSQFHVLQPFISSSTTTISFVTSTEQLITHISDLPMNEVTLAHSDLTTKSSSTSTLNAFSSIGGLEKELSSIREAVELPLLQPELFSTYGVKPPRGVLLYGPPGTGKTMIARALASQATASFFSLSGAEITGRLLGEAEARIRSIFATAAERAPSVVFIDEIDALCPHRDGADETQKRVVAALLSILDGVHAMRGVVLLAATNRPNALDPALRRPGRLDREIEIGVPSREGRMDILIKALQSVRHILSRDEIQAVAEKAHGYVGADLQLVVREAALHCMHRLFSQDFSFQTHQELDDIDLNHESLGPLHGLCLTLEDLKEGLASVKPSALRSVALDVPNVRWDDVGGQWEVKERLKEAFEWPLEDPEVFSRLGVPSPKGVLLYGPPGCSKTLLAKALATESSRNFLAVKGPELFSKWVGDSEKAVREVFRKARAAAPSIIFFDEIDSIAAARGGGGGGGADQAVERVLSQLLVELDGVDQLTDVTVLAATNRPDILDKALLRPGRIDRALYVSPPDEVSTGEILQIEFRKMSVDEELTKIEVISQLAKIAHAKRLSGAELSACCREAALLAMEDDSNAQHVAFLHLKRAFESAQPRISQQMIEFYENYQKSCGMAAV